jgi:hypothetical protein
VNREQITVLLDPDNPMRQRIDVWFPPQLENAGQYEADAKLTFSSCNIARGRAYAHDILTDS